jgi:hypothetical protein
MWKNWGEHNIEKNQRRAEQEDKYNLVPESVCAVIPIPA